jgi:hypothetical protein
MSNPPTCLAVDYGSTISTGTIDHLIGQKPVDPDAAAALRTLHDDHGLRIILASKHSATRVLRASQLVTARHIPPSDRQRRVTNGGSWCGRVGPGFLRREQAVCRDRRPGSGGR